MRLFCDYYTIQLVAHCCTVLLVSACTWIAISTLYTLYDDIYCVTITGRYDVCINFALLRLMILFVPRRRFELFVFCLFVCFLRAFSSSPKPKP